WLHYSVLNSHIAFNSPIPGIIKHASKSLKLIGWDPPHEDWIKMNTGDAGGGGILRDKNGCWKGGFPVKYWI
ncbi:conserved hypothetical protein, partial [Ricinus communis]